MVIDRSRIDFVGDGDDMIEGVLHDLSKVAPFRHGLIVESPFSTIAYRCVSVADKHEMACNYSQMGVPSPIRVLHCEPHDDVHASFLHQPEPCRRHGNPMTGNGDAE